LRDSDSEAWRYTGPFTRWNRFKGTLPGLGTATVAFTIYCLYEHFFMKDEAHGHAEGEH
jgi:NADH dehydrogenase (ubiquinone) 1 beta subcomplex subunit 3